MSKGHQELETPGTHSTQKLGPVVLNKKFIANIEIDSLHTGISKVRKTIFVPFGLKQEDWGGEADGRRRNK